MIPVSPRRALGTLPSWALWVRKRGAFDIERCEPPRNGRRSSTPQSPTRERNRGKVSGRLVHPRYSAPDSAPLRLLPVGITHGEALYFATLGNPFSAYPANSITPKMQREIQRTHKSLVETVKRRRGDTHRMCRISLRIRRTRNRSARRLPPDAPSRKLNLTLIKSLAGTFGFGDMELYRGLALRMNFVGGPQTGQH